MSIYLTLQLGFGLFLGVLTVFSFRRIKRQEAKLQTEGIESGCTALIDPLALFTMILVLMLLALIMPRGASWFQEVTVNITLLFMNISIYYAALLFLLPLLRRIISARACAALWIAPSMLYSTFRIYDMFANPIFIITLPNKWLNTFTWIWIAGFASVAIWQVLSHFWYRSFLEKNSERVKDEHILAVWSKELERHGVEKNIPVFISPSISTPLTIGCYKRTMRLYLPGLSYSDEELALIFRHELRHIVRLDTRMKLFMDIFTAISWFNPLAWIARRKASDDLELSCDEAVLSNADETTRSLYAELLLKNAGKNRGFTTCLSVEAKSMRYRLRSVVKPAKRLSGGVVVGAALFGLFMMIGTSALADSADTVQNQIFDKAMAGLVADGVSVSRWNDKLPAYTKVYGWNKEALSDYIASLSIKQIYKWSFNGVYALRESDDKSRQLHVNYTEAVDGKTVNYGDIEIRERMVLVTIINTENHKRNDFAYALDSKPDWDYIESLLDFDAPNPDPPPVPPDMMMYFNEEINSGGKLMQASRTVRSISRGNTRLGINENLNDEGIGGVSGYPVTQVTLNFSYAPAGGYSVRVENWERTESYGISSEDLENNVLPLAPYDAHYTVSGTFVTVWDTTYVVEFTFDVKLP